MLMAVARLQGADGIGVRRLADHLHVAAPHVTTEIGKLVRLGLVAKRPNPADRRGVLIRLSEAGKAAVNHLAGFVVDINDILFDGVDRDEFQAVLRFVDRFVGNTGRALREVEEREPMAHPEAAE
jgi:DNA-binding MarR family transcriptional regulator